MRVLLAGSSARRRRISAAVFAVAVAVAVATAGRARAADLFSPFTLDWDAPAGCPDGAAVEQETARLLRGSGRTGAPPLQAHAKVDHPEGRVWRMQLQTGRGGARRTVQAATCRELADAAAFILAAAVDPDDPEEGQTRRQARPQTSAPAPRPVPVDPHEVPPDEPPPPPRPSAEPVLSPLAVSAALWVDGGLLPGGAIAPAIALEYRPRRVVVLEVAVAYFPHSHADTEGDVDFQLGAGDVRVGYVLAPGRVEATLVAGAELDWLHGRGDGGPAAGTGGAPFVSALAGPRIRCEIVPDWAVRVEVDGVIPVERPLFVLDASSIVHQPSVISGRASFSVERRF